MEISIDNTTYRFPDRPTELLEQCNTLQNQSSTMSNDQHSLHCVTATLLGILYAYPFPALLVIGVIGNTLTIIVLGFKSIEVSRHSIYLCGVAFADTLHLLFVGFGWLFLAKGLPWATRGGGYVYLMNFGIWPCRLYRFFAGLASIHAYNSFLLVAADRCLAVYFPFQFMNVGNKTAMRLTIGTLLISVLSAMPFIIMMGYVTVPEEKLVFCWLTTGSQAFQLYDALYVKGVAQMLLIFLINLALLIKMAQVTRKHRRLVNGSHNTGGSIPKQLESEEMKATIMIVLLSVLILICAVPAASLGLVNYIMVYLSRNASSSQLQLMWNWMDISLFLVFLEQSTKWIAYLVQSRTFRRKMLIYLRYRRRS